MKNTDNHDLGSGIVKSANLSFHQLEYAHGVKWNFVEGPKIILTQLVKFSFDWRVIFLGVMLKCRGMQSIAAELAELHPSNSQACYYEENQLRGCYETAACRREISALVCCLKA